jgi:hypothetical protein
MDTSLVPVQCAGISYPAWAIEAVRQGARVALELLRSPVLPEQVWLTDSWFATPGHPPLADRAPVSEGWTPQASASALGREPSDVGVARPAGTPEPVHPVVDAHSATVLYLSHPAILSRSYLGDPPYPVETMRRALAYCAGFGAARFVFDRVTVLGGASWLPTTAPFSPDADTDESADRARYRMATAVAAAGSGWTMMAKDGPGDPQSEAAMFFLRRLAAIRRDEGAATLWRGALGKSVRAFVQQLRFSAIPGTVARVGQRLPTYGDVLSLVQYADGQAEWPFPRPPAP